MGAYHYMGAWLWRRVALLLLRQDRNKTNELEDLRRFVLAWLVSLLRRGVVWLCDKYKHYDEERFEGLVLVLWGRGVVSEGWISSLF